MRSVAGPPDVAWPPPLVVRSDDPPPTSRRRALPRHRSVALLDMLAIFVTSALVFSLHGYDGVLSRDLGVFTYGGEQVAHGVPPYVGIFNSVGPLADAVPGLAIWAGHLVGLSPVLAARFAFTLISAGCCAVLYVLARDVFRSRPAGFVAPAVLVTFMRFSQLASDGPREKTTMVLLLLVAFVLLCRGRWTAAGVVTALATLTWQPSLLPPVAAVVVLVLLDRHRWRGAVRFVIGGIVTAGAAAAAFWLIGALVPAVRGFLLVNLFYTHQSSVFADGGQKWTMLSTAYGVSLPVGIAGLAALIVGGVFARPLARRMRRQARPVPWRLAAVAAGAAAATGWTLAVINGAQDPFVALPFAALGVAGVVVLLVDALPRPWAVTCGVLVVTAAVTLAGWQLVTTRDFELLRQHRDVAAVLATEPPNATVMSVDAPEMVALADRRDVSSYQLFDPRMVDFLDHTVPGGIRGFVHRIERRRPTFVAVSSELDHSRWLEPMLRAHYAHVGRGPEWQWFVRRSVGTRSVDAARAANASAMAHRPRVGSRFG